MPRLSNPKYEFFAHELAMGKMQLESYVLAGYSESASNACTLAAKPEIIARIEEIQSAMADRAQVKADRVLAELARIGFADITQAVQIVKGKVKIADTADMPDSIKAAISEIRKGRDGVTVKLHDKRAALEALGKHLGLFKENIDLNVNVSLADLVNGSYKLERGELTAASEQQTDSATTIEHKPQVDEP